MLIQVNEHAQIILDDVRDGLKSLKTGSVHCVMTSPPYWGLRDYGFKGQIGSEKTPAEFVDVMVRVFREVKRVLRDDGVLFVNLGDTFATGAGSARDPGSRVYGKLCGVVTADAVPKCQPNRMDFGLAAGNKIGIPWMVALGLVQDGWILRQDVIWNKPSPMPASVSGWRWRRCRVKTGSFGVSKQSTAGPVPDDAAHRGNKGGRGSEQRAKFSDCQGCDKCSSNGGYVLQRGSWRPTTGHEFIFQFVKSSTYFCDGDGSKEPAAGGTPGNVTRKSTRNMRSVWKMSSEGFKGAHFATFPTELPRRCLSAATSRGGCCSACGSQYAPVIESKRSATRPGTNSKVNRASSEEESPYHDHSGSIVGNRDPERHTTTTVVTGYLPTCRCGAEKARPTVLDIFCGSGTTGQVAINMGCQFIGIEGNADYVELAKQRINTPWKPKDERDPKAPKQLKPDKAQLELFTD